MQKDEACELPHHCFNTLILVPKDILDFTDRFVDLQLCCSIPLKKMLVRFIFIMLQRREKTKASLRG